MSTQSLELKLLLHITRHLPKVRGSGTVSHKLKSWYLRRPRPKLRAECLGFTLDLDPHEQVDGELLFHPELYDRHEFKFMRNNLRPGDKFIDVGAYIGMYSLVASRLVGESGRVLALEANPATFARLQDNLGRNDAPNVTPVCGGASDTIETAKLFINKDKNIGMSSFLYSYEDSVDVRCLPLWCFCKDHGFLNCSGMKIDIEGFEYRVLSAYFRDSPKASQPRFIICEYYPDRAGEAGGDAAILMKRAGYREVFRGPTTANRIFVRNGL